MLPLHDIRVVTMALNAPGPVAAARLRDAGAAVTKVEPLSGDPLEGYCTGWYRELHEGITIERIDLKSAGGRSRMGELLAKADLLLASQRPSALERLGLDAATLLSPHSRLNHLRWVNIVGELENPETPGHDLTYLAKAGLLGREIPRSLFADVLAGLHAFATAVLLLRQPPGSSADVGLYDTLAPLAAARAHGLTGPGNMLGGAVRAYGIYDAREGRIAVAALERHFRIRLYHELNLVDGTELTEAFRARTASEWEQWARERDLPITAVMD
ncbi:MAG TPA: CoA transferase [Vicinamibacterales bacterium]|nr:CoA transferase [Vicinamibacterales bacterium]